jgi:hypothetical protein
VNTYTSGQDGGGAPEHPDSREWVFGLLANPRYRRRMEQLEGLDLRRRPGCEPCLRALVTGEWTPEALHHLGWCDSCGAAAVALGMHAPAAASSFFRRRAGWLAVAAFAVVAVPLVGSQVINQGSQARGGGAIRVPAATTGKPSTAPSTTPGTTTPATTTPGTTTPGTTTPVTPVPRSKPSASGNLASARGHKALPHTT